MQAIRSKNTSPERLVRRLASKLGYRYRLHRSELPGKPDLSFIGKRKAVFVHGCFWHGHDCPRGARLPKTNSDYWAAKITRNQARDAKHVSALKASGWTALVIWECELKDQEAVQSRIAAFLRDR